MINDEQLNKINNINEFSKWLNKQPDDLQLFSDLDKLYTASCPVARFLNDVTGCSCLVTSFMMHIDDKSYYCENWMENFILCFDKDKTPTREKTMKLAKEILNRPKNWNAWNIKWNYRSKET